jgi:hypothetical protein
MSVAMTAENPTEAVRERITVPAGCFMADEFARPARLIFSFVSEIVVLMPLRS